MRLANGDMRKVLNILQVGGGGEEAKRKGRRGKEERKRRGRVGREEKCFEGLTKRKEKGTVLCVFARFVERD